MPCKKKKQDTDHSWNCDCAVWIDLLDVAENSRNRK